MNNFDKTYLDRLRFVLNNGQSRMDRTGTGTVGVFGEQMRFDMSIGDFPLLTSKSVHWSSVVHELVWLLSGDTNIRYLKENGVKIWDAWSLPNGDLGPVYGTQWRNFGGEVDQISELVKNLKENPFSRRHIVSAWNPMVLPDESISPVENAARGLQALPPCHAFFQFYVSELDDSLRSMIATHRGIDIQHIPRLGLSCQLYQRSADMFLGVPFNIASYSLLTHLVAKTVDMYPMEFVWTGGDCHIYKNHVDQVELQLSRESSAPKSPSINIKVKRDRLEDYTFDDIELIGYEHMGSIKAPISV